MSNTIHAIPVSAPSAAPIAPETAHALDDGALRARALQANMRRARAGEALSPGINGGLREAYRALQRQALDRLDDQCGVLHAELERRGMRPAGDQPAGASRTSDASARWDLQAPRPRAAITATRDAR